MSSVSLPKSLVVPATLLVGFACTPAMEPVGITPAHAQKAPPPASASASAPVWSRAAELSKLPKANAKRFASSHLFGRYDADVFINEPSRAMYASVAPGTSASIGTTVVEVHTDRDGTPGPVFAMEKGTSGWTYLELDPRLHIVRQGRLSPCVECHVHVASQDELFGVPSTGR